MTTSRAGLNDLKLLADVANAHEVGQTEFFVDIGFREAAKRLERAGLVDRNPTGILHSLRLSIKGSHVIDRMLNVLEGSFKK